MTLLCYERCSTCKRAQKWLEEQGIAYKWRDIKGQNPTAEELGGWQRQSGLPLRRFFNTSGMVYKQQNLKDKLPGLSEEQQLVMLASDGMLVKRPLLVSADFVLVGFSPDVWRKTVKER